VGAGPYILESYVKGEKTVLKKNPNYFHSQFPYLDGIVGQTILDQNTLIQGFKAGQFDTCGATLTKLDYEDLVTNKNVFGVKLPGLYYGSLGMNASTKPFNDPRVRQAFYIGVDRAQFIDKVFQGEAVPMGPLSAGLDFWALPQDQLKPYLGPDIKKAKELLSAAGYADGLDLDIETSNGVQLYIDHAEVLVSELKKIGVNANLKLTDLSTYLSTKLFTGDFTATVFTHNPYETPRTPIRFYHKQGVGDSSWWHYDNPIVNEIVEKTDRELDAQKRKQLMFEAQKAILDDAAPLLNLASPTMFLAYSKRLGGIDPKVRGFQNFRYSEYIKKDV
jgi:peptide/nickel transport system substrate-binding protein